MFYPKSFMQVTKITGEELEKEIADRDRTLIVDL